MSSDFLDPASLAAIGFGALGQGVRISRNAVLLAPHRMRIGDDVRIDAFCVLSAGEAGLTIGRNVHISAMTTILGHGLVEIGDFATISVRCALFSSTDDYSGASMTNPTIPAKYRRSTDGPLRIGAHAILGSGCVVLPDVRIGESAAVGALSLVKSDVPAFKIAVGTPARIVGDRLAEHRRMAELLLEQEAAARQPTD